MAANKAYTKAQNTDKIPLKDTIIHRSVGAKFKNYKVVDKTTGVEYVFAAGSRIQDSEVFAGKGTKHPLHEGVAEVYRNSMAKMYQSGNMLKDMARYLIRTQEMN